MEKIIGLICQVNSVNLHSTRFNFLIRSKGSVLGDDVNFDPLLLKLEGQVLHMRADPSYDSRRVLPRQHDHAHQSHYRQIEPPSGARERISRFEPAHHMIGVEQCGGRNS